MIPLTPGSRKAVMKALGPTANGIPGTPEDAAVSGRKAAPNPSPPNRGVVSVVIDDANLGEKIAVRQMVYLALTYDHRLVDGADAARFLSDVKARLESGQFEV